MCSRQVVAGKCGAGVIADAACGDAVVGGVDVVDAPAMPVADLIGGFVVSWRQRPARWGRFGG